MPLILEPLHDQIVVAADAAEEKSRGGVILPDRSKKIPWRGTVIAVGPDVTSNKTVMAVLDVLTPVDRRKIFDLIAEARPDLLEKQIKVGDRVYWAQYSGTPYEWEYKHYYILQQKEILGKVVEGEYNLGDLKAASLEGAEYVSTMTDKDFDYASQVRPKTPTEMQQEHELGEMLRKG